MKQSTRKEFFFSEKFVYEVNRSENGRRCWIDFRFKEFSLSFCNINPNFILQIVLINFYTSFFSWMDMMPYVLFDKRNSVFFLLAKDNVKDHFKMIPMIFLRCEKKTNISTDYGSRERFSTGRRQWDEVTCSRHLHNDVISTTSECETVALEKLAR